MMAQSKFKNFILRSLQALVRTIRYLRETATQAETDPQQGQKRPSDILTGIFIGLFLVGILTFLTRADFKKEGWTEAYFLWDKGKDIFLLCLLYVWKVKFRLYLRLIIGLATIRFVWDITAYCLKTDINLQPAITTLWVTATATIIFLSIKELISRWCQD